MFGSEVNLSDRLLIGVRSLFYFRVDSSHLPIKFYIFIFSCFIIVLNLDMNDQIKFILLDNYFFIDFKT